MSCLQGSRASRRLSLILTFCLRDTLPPPSPRAKQDRETKPIHPSISPPTPPPPSRSFISKRSNDPPSRNSLLGAEKPESKPEPEPEPSHDCAVLPPPRPPPMPPPRHLPHPSGPRPPPSLFGPPPRPPPLARSPAPAQPSRSRPSLRRSPGRGGGGRMPGGSPGHPLGPQRQEARLQVAGEAPGPDREGVLRLGRHPRRLSRHVRGKVRGPGRSGIRGRRRHGGGGDGRRGGRGRGRGA